MCKRKLIAVILIILIFNIMHIGIPLIYPWPETTLNLDQASFLTLFLDPVIQLLFCAGFLLMLAGLIFFSEPDSAVREEIPLILLIMLGLTLFAILILLRHWTYIHTNCKDILVILVHESRSLGAGKLRMARLRALTPAKSIISMFGFLLVIPVLYWTSVSFKRLKAQEKNK